MRTLVRTQNFNQPLHQTTPSRIQVFRYAPRFSHTQSKLLLMQWLGLGCRVLQIRGGSTSLSVRYMENTQNEIRSLDSRVYRQCCLS